MDKGSQHIDEYFSSRVNEMELEPSERVWNTIEAGLDKQGGIRKHTRRNYRLLSGILFLSGIVAAAFTYYGIQLRPTTTPGTASFVKASKNILKEDLFTANNSLQDKHKKLFAIDAGTQRAVKETVVCLTNEKPEMVFVNTDPASYLAEVTKEAADKKQDLISFAHGASLVAYNMEGDPKQKTAIPSLTTDPFEPLKAEQAENVVLVPNAFTPNGDGLNDVLLPESDEIPKEYQLNVQDLSGNLVFHSDDIHKGWDGHRLINGSDEVKEDVYIWNMEIKFSTGEKKHLVGSVTLLR